MEFERIDRIESSDKRHALEVMRNPSGQCRFTVFEWVESKDDVDRVFHGAGYWSFSQLSGLYESETAAVIDARQSLPWLKETQG